MKAVLTMSAEDRTTTNFRGFAGSTRELYLRPLPSIRVNDLLDEVVSGLDDDTKTWISREADGNPGMVLAAADLRHRLKRGAPSLLDAMVLGMEYRIRREFGDHGIRILRLLSLMTEVDTSDQELSEISTMCRILGEKVQPKAVLEALPRFEVAGIVHHVGRYVEVVPSFLADQLALDVLRSHPDRTSTLLNAFELSGRLRVAERRPILEEEREAITYVRAGDAGGLQPSLQLSY